jgi:hypothetical protein
MKVLLLHCKNYRTAVGELATRPKDITPETISEDEKVFSAQDCVVALITAENGDDPHLVSTQCAAEIISMVKDVKRKKVVLLPFAHLSSNLASTKDSLTVLETIQDEVEKEYTVDRGHFGSHKELLLDTYGHAGNVRFREF